MPGLIAWLVASVIVAAGSSLGIVVTALVVIATDESGTPKANARHKKVGAALTLTAIVAALSAVAAVLVIAGYGLSTLVT